MFSQTQVEDLDRQFKQLSELESNGWKDKEEEENRRPQPPKKKKKPSVTGPQKKKTAAGDTEKNGLVVQCALIIDPNFSLSFVYPGPSKARSALRAMMAAGRKEVAAAASKEEEEEGTKSLVAKAKSGDISGRRSSVLLDPRTPGSVLRPANRAMEKVFEGGFFQVRSPRSEKMEEEERKRRSPRIRGNRLEFE